MPVQMDHMLVNEAYRVWHGAPHLDDARQAPLNIQHFDGYRMGPTTYTPFKPGERIHGLAVGGWFDAGDFDIQGGPQRVHVSGLVDMWETFRPDSTRRSSTRSSASWTFTGRMVSADVLQQIEHGALQIAAQFQIIGHVPRGIVTASSTTTITSATVRADRQPALRPGPRAV